MEPAGVAPGNKNRENALSSALNQRGSEIIFSTALHLSPFSFYVHDAAAVSDPGVLLYHSSIPLFFQKGEDIFPISVLCFNVFLQCSCDFSDLSGIMGRSNMTLLQIKKADA
jgi:hypothetical protein